MVYILGFLLVVVLGYLAVYTYFVGVRRFFMCFWRPLHYWRGTMFDTLITQHPIARDGNRLELLVNGDALLRAYLAEIAQAKTSLRWSVMLFRPDTVGNRLADALIDASQRGVSVYLACSFDYISRIAVSDNLAELEKLEAFVARLHANGVQVCDTSNSLKQAPETLSAPSRQIQDRLRKAICLERDHYDHRKVMIRDHTHAIIASANVGDEYLYATADNTVEQWLDIGVRLQGTAINDLALSFDQFWEIYSGEVLPKLSYSVAMGQVAVSALAQRPGLDEIGVALMDAIGTAQRSIVVAVPYLSHRATLDALCDAQKRGVAVTIVFPYEQNDVPLFKRYLASHSARLLASGVTVYLNHQRMVHSKIVVVDDSWVCMGSFNLNYRSYYHDYELNIAFVDANFAKDVSERVFAPYIALSDVLTEAIPVQLTWMQRIIEPFA